eukprot:1160545-Pelagomonas_calceolata.AAC.14
MYRFAQCHHVHAWQCSLPAWLRFNGVLASQHCMRGMLLSECQTFWCLVQGISTSGMYLKACHACTSKEEA